MNDNEVRRLLAIIEADNTPAPPMELWPCHACGLPGVRNVAAQGYCSAHLHQLYATFHPAAFANGGIGLQTGPLRPEYGPLEADLTCCRCDATWTGIPGDPCWWCRRLAEIDGEHQAQLLLAPPDVDPDDARYEARMGAWADRLVVGVTAGLISQQDAERAWARATKAKAA